MTAKDIANIVSSQEFILGIIASLIGALILWGFEEFVKAVRTRSPFTGYWFSLIYENEEIVKSDLYHLKHNRRTKEVSGWMERVFPLEQKGRKWRVTGIQNGQDLIIFSHSNKLSTSTAAAVCRLTRDNYFEGFYLRYSENKKEIEKVEIHYKKNPDMQYGSKKKRIEMIKKIVLLTSISAVQDRPNFKKNR